MSVSIDIAVFDGVDELDVIAPFEVLSNAARAVPDVQVRLVTLEERSEVTGACGLGFSVHGRWVPGAADILIVPGGGWGTKADIGVFGEVRRGDWSRPLQAARAGTRLMASVCTGALLLAEAGLLQHRRAILTLLKDGEKAASELAEPFDISFAAISQHLRVLKDAELLSERRDGRQRLYQLRPRPLAEVASWIDEFQTFFEARLDALEDHLDRKHGRKAKRAKRPARNR